MQGYLKVNILGIILFLAILMISGMLPESLMVIMLILWLVVVILLNYMEYMSKHDIVYRLQKAPKGGYFQHQVINLSKNYMAIKSQSKMIRRYDDDSSVVKAYNLISSQMNNIIESAIKYINSYNYYSRPRPDFLNELVRESETLVGKLNELQDLMLKVDDSTSDVDVSYVDDMLDALRQMRDEKN